MKRRGPAISRHLAEDSISVVVRIYDLLYLDTDADGNDFYNVDKTWDAADLIELIAAEVSRVYREPEKKEE